jgi:F-type H+-transporting ATPase subunit b
MDLITPEFGLVFWTLITFLVLLFILKKFAWKPILGAVSEREEGIKEALASAVEARKEMENLKADNERILKEARTEREAMLKEARELKNKMIDDAKQDAKSQASKLVTQAQAAIEAEKKSCDYRFKITGCANLHLNCRESGASGIIKSRKAREISPSHVR